MPRPARRVQRRPDVLLGCALRAALTRDRTRRARRSPSTRIVLHRVCLYFALGALNVVSSNVKNEELQEHLEMECAF
eukprot:7376990-Prymnesium_polylepis.1